MNANNDDPIVWESDYKLQETDFLGKPPANPIQVDAQHVEVAQSAVGINWKLGKTEIVQTKSERAVKFCEVGIDTMFDRNQSWISDIDSMSEARKKTMLVHEQGHFDMAEMFCRMAREEVLKAINNKTFFLHETDDEKINQEIKEIAENVIGTIIDKNRKEMDEEQQEYEDKTLHGLNEKKQLEYTQNFDNSLRP